LLFAAALWGADPWVGVWKMNPAKMGYWPHHMLSQLLTIEKLDAGYRFSYDVEVLGGGHQKYRYDYKLSHPASRELVAEDPKTGASKAVLGANGQSLTTYIKDAKSGKWDDPVIFDKSK